MYTRVLELKAQSQFGDELNPLWQMCGFENNQMSLVPCESQLIPFDTISNPEAWDASHWSARTHFQIYLKSPDLTEELLRKTYQARLRLQIWFDAPFNEAEVKNLMSHGYDHIEWVYCPRLLYHPAEIFPESTRPLFRELVIHLNPKAQAHDSWPDFHTLWYYWLWTKQYMSVQKCQMQIFAHVLDQQTDQNRFFLLNPRERNWHLVMKSEFHLLWYVQSVTDRLFTAVYETFEKVLLFKKWLIETKVKALLLWQRMTLPFRKVYWFFEYQFQKRILRRTSL